jgi:hypothetical protein
MLGLDKIQSLFGVVPMVFGNCIRCLFLAAIAVLIAAPRGATALDVPMAAKALGDSVPLPKGFLVSCAQVSIDRDTTSTIGVSLAFRNISDKPIIVSDPSRTFRVHLFHNAQGVSSGNPENARPDFASDGTAVRSSRQESDAAGSSLHSRHDETEVTTAYWVDSRGSKIARTPARQARMIEIQPSETFQIHYTVKSQRMGKHMFPSGRYALSISVPLRWQDGTYTFWGSKPSRFVFRL